MPSASNIKERNISFKEHADLSKPSVACSKLTINPSLDRAGLTQGPDYSLLVNDGTFAG